MEFLGPASCIVHSPIFESGICKFIENKQLNVDEEEAMLHFKIQTITDDENNDSFAEQV